MNSTASNELRHSSSHIFSTSRQVTASILAVWFCLLFTKAMHINQPRAITATKLTHLVKLATHDKHGNESKSVSTVNVAHSSLDKPQAVPRLKGISRQPLTVETRVQSQTSSCDICAGQNDTACTMPPDVSRSFIHPIPTEQRLGGLQSRSGIFLRTENLLPLLGFVTRTAQ